MAKLTTTDLASLTSESSAVSAINDNFAAVETALENTLSRDGTSPNSMESDFDMNSNDILNAGDVEADTLTLNGLTVTAEDVLGSTTVTIINNGEGDVKEPVATATTANITLSGEQTIDGVLTSASRVLVKDQSDASENGIYLSGAGAWSRATDADDNGELQPGTLVWVDSEATVNGDKLFTLTTPSNVEPVIGTTDQTWSSITPAARYKSNKNKGVLVTTYTLELADANCILYFYASDPVTVTIPTKAAVNFSNRVEIGLVNYGGGAITVVADTGVTLYSPGDKTISRQYGLAWLKKKGANTWFMNGEALSTEMETLHDLTDPAADRILFWDTSASAYGQLTVGSGLTLSGTTLSADASSAAWGAITGTLSDQTDLQAELDAILGYGYIVDAAEVDLPNSRAAASSTSVTVNTSLSGYISFERAALTGDITASANSNATTLATVNANVGSFGGASTVPVITVNAKGLVTAVSTASVSATVGDADYGDITVASGVWTIDNAAVTYAKTSAGVQASLDLADSSLQSSDIGSTVQAYDADLATIAGLTATTDNFIQSKSSAWASRTPTQVAADLSSLIKPVEHIAIACSDETTALTTGTAKVTFRMPYAFTLTSVRASVTTAPTGANLNVDINESGVTILSTILSIDAGEKTSTTAATPVVISDTSLADDAEITIDIDQIGSTVAGAGLKVYLIGTRT